MTEEEQTWALALKIQQWLGDTAPVYIAQQLGAVALAGDKPGIARWQAIAAAYDRLQSGARQ